MGHLFRHNQNQKLYTIEHLIHDIWHLNKNANRGIYATPYNWKGEKLTHTYNQKESGLIDEYNPEQFVLDNFEIVADL